MSGKKARAARRALYIGPDPDNAPDGHVNAARIREAANLAGRCPSCGATFEYSAPPRRGTIVHAYMRHEVDCPCLRDDHL